MTENRQYAEMRRAAAERLAVRDPAELAARGGLDYDRERGSMALRVFGQELTLRFPSLELTPEPGMWIDLTILQYLDAADGTPLTGRDMGLSEFAEGGLVRGSSFDRENDRLLARIGSFDPAVIRAAAAKLGGEELDSRADLCFRFRFLPRFPMTVSLWLADEEFPAGGKVLLDASAEHYLLVEAAGSLGVVLLEKLAAACAGD